MNEEPSQIIIVIFFVTWVLLGGVGIYLFFVSKNYERKKTWLKPYHALVGGLFFVFLVLMKTPIPMLMAAVPALLLIYYLNVRNTAFCPTCGKTTINSWLFGKVRFCAGCGAELEKTEADS